MSLVINSSLEIMLTWGVNYPNWRSACEQHKSGWSHWSRLSKRPRKVRRGTGHDTRRRWRESGNLWDRSRPLCGKAPRDTLVRVRIKKISCAWTIYWQILEDKELLDGMLKMKTNMELYWFCFSLLCERKTKTNPTLSRAFSCVCGGPYALTRRSLWFIVTFPFFPDWPWW